MPNRNSWNRKTETNNNNQSNNQPTKSTNKIKPHTLTKQQTSAQQREWSIQVGDNKQNMRKVFLVTHRVRIIPNSRKWNNQVNSWLINRP